MRKNYEKLKRLEVREKSGFRNVNGKPIIILDERGKVFYDTRDLKNIVWEFNLPVGVYYVLQGKFVKRASPVPYEMTPLRKPERIKHGNPEHFNVQFIRNPHTGTIAWDERQIYLDNDLKNLSMPMLVFVLYHEFGHRYYKTEEFCDIYARNRMLMEGYNPSQIGESVIHTLPASQYKRMENVVNTLI